MAFAATTTFTQLQDDEQKALNNLPTFIMLHRITTLFQHRDGEPSNATQFPSLDEKINCELKKMTFLMKQSKRKLATQ